MSSNQVPEGYKQTEVGVIPDDWEASYLGDVAEVIMGQSPNGNSYNKRGDGIPLINGPTEFTAKHPIKVQWTTEPTKLCQAGDLLLCVRGSSTGRMNVSTGEFCIGRGISAIRANDKSVTKYLTYQIDLAIEGLLSLSTGSTFPSVDGKAIKSIPIPCPKREEQRAIAATLSDVDALIASLDKLIAKQRHLKTATMQQLLTGKKRLPGFGEGKGYKQTEVGAIPEDWDVKFLGEDAVIYSGGTPSTSNQDYYGGGIPWITSGDLNKRYISEVEGKITEKGLRNSSAKMIPSSTLLIALYGATAGVAAMSKIEAAINQAVLAILPNTIDKSFLFYVLTLRKEQIIETYTQGGQPNLSGEIIRSLPVAVPKREEQRAIAT